MSKVLTKSQQLLYLLIKHNGGINDKIKLAKLEYLADFIHFAFNDNSISDANCNIYTRQKYGPLSRMIDVDLQSLKDGGYISEDIKFDYKTAALAPNITLSEAELKTIQYVLNRFGKDSWDDLVNITHAQAPYLSALDGQIIEFFTAYNLIDDCPDYDNNN